MITKSPTALVKRPPIIAVMGHIDHGKSTLLDYIRKTNIVEKEFGGITQHISAYEVNHKRENGAVEKITFLDTPGHEAFKAMRSRGAAAADIAILVVSAEDGVKPQTLEALNTIVESKTPYLVAITKIDKPNANLEKTKQSLAENGIYIEGYGGNIPTVPISAKTGENVDQLLEMILLLSDLEDLKGNENAPFEGVVIESNLDTKKGMTATVVVKNGKIETCKRVVSAKSICPLRMMEDFMGKKIESATFSSPIRIIGWSELPKVGSIVSACASKKEAEEMAKSHKKESQNAETIIPEGVHIIPLVIKADVLGVSGAVMHEVEKLNNDRVHLKILHTGAGNITDNDAKIALPFPGAIILGFNVKIEDRAQDLADRNNITIKVFNVIYHLSEWLQTIIKERTPKIEVEEILGSLKVLKVFNQSKTGQVVGGKVLSGTLSVKDSVRVTRGEMEVARGIIGELQQSKSKTGKISEGEAGLSIEGVNNIQGGDVIEAVQKVTK